MTTRFTRVTVVGEGRQVDISLPAGTPLAEQLPTVLRLLSVPTRREPVRWRLAAPEFGALDPSRSLDDVGVLDGAQLYLAEAASAPPPPFVEDVESTVAELVTGSAPIWASQPRRSGAALLLAPVLLAAVVSAIRATGAVTWIGPAAVLVVALGAGRLIPERGGWAPALTAVPAALALLVGLVPASLPGGDSLTKSLHWNGFPLLAGMVAAIALLLVGMTRCSAPVASAAAGMLPVAAGAWWCARMALPADRTAGLGLVAAVVLAGMAGQVALGGTGLVDLMVAGERGDPVTRTAVAASVARGLGVAGGLVCAAALVAATSCSVLLLRVPDVGTSTGWVAPALGALGGLIFGLRSRMFTRAAHVGPMLGVPVVAAVMCASRAPRWLSAGPATGGVVTLVLLVIAGVTVTACGWGALREVSGARVERILERLELVAVLALVPALVLLFDVLPMVHRWWG